MRTALRKEMRRKRELLENEGLPSLDLTDSRIEEELLRRVRGRLTFYSFTLRRIKPDTVASCFIVRTHRPVRWRDFIIRVALALEDLV